MEKGWGHSLTFIKSKCTKGYSSCHFTALYKYCAKI